VGTNGLLRLNWSDNGTNVYSSTSSVVTGITDGASKWIRVTLDVDDGAGNSATNFYTADDSATYPTSWTQLGATITRAGTTNIFDSTNALTVGPPSGTSGSSGTFYRAIVKDGIGGTTVFDADFSTQTADALAFTESSANAATVTINTTRYSYGVPNSPYAAVSTFAATSGLDYIVPFRVSKRTVVDMAMFEVTTGPASNSTVHIGLYPADENMQPSGSVITNFGPITVPASTTGVFLQQVTPVTLEAGTYIIAINVSVNFTFRTVRSPNEFLAQAMGANPIRRFLTKIRANATFPTTYDPWAASTQASVGWDLLVFLRYKAAT
jgi:hypothetical protein